MVAVWFWDIPGRGVWHGAEVCKYCRGSLHVNEIFMIFNVLYPNPFWFVICKYSSIFAAAIFLPLCFLVMRYSPILLYGEHSVIVFSHDLYNEFLPRRDLVTVQFSASGDLIFFPTSIVRFLSLIVSIAASPSSPFSSRCAISPEPTLLADALCTATSTCG